MHARTDDQQLNAVRSYYDQTRLDYGWLWFTRNNPSIHFGYRDTRARRHGESLTNMNRVLAERVPLRAGMKVLDAGCGVGGTSRFFARQYGATVVGITPVAGQVAQATRLSKRQGLAGLATFEQNDYLDTGYPEASFDVVLAQESVCHSNDKRGFLAEAFRVLRPGGRLVIAEYFHFDRQTRSARDESIIQSWYRGWAMPDLAVGTDFTGWAIDCGFTQVQLDDVTEHVRPSLRRLHRITVALYPGELALRALRIRSAVQHGNVQASRDQWRALQRGLWYYGIFTATKGAR